MPSNTRNFILGCNVHLVVTGLAAGGLLLSILEIANAQDAVLTEPTNYPAVNPPISSPVPPSPAVEVNPANESNGEVVEGAGAAGYAPQQRRLQYGFHLTLRGVYDDNINVSHFNKVSDFYFAIEPSITLGFGDVGGRQENYLSFEYSPSAFLFVEHSEDDAVQHLIRLEGHYRFSRLDLTLVQDVQILDGTDLGSITDASAPGTHANLDVSGRTRVNIYTTQLNGNYDITGKTFLSAGANSTITDYPTLISSQVISGNLFINYKYSEKIVVGLGGTGGYDFVDAPNPDQTFEQANVRLSYQATGKISLNASGGVEFRQFEQTARNQYVSPVFEISAAYQPFDGTNLSAGLARRTLNSAVLAGQDFASTTISIGARQRLFQRVYLGLNVGYQNADYFSTISAVSTNRSDNYYFIEPAVDVMVTRFWTVGGYYLHRQDDSSVANFSFDDNQVGFRTVLTF